MENKFKTLLRALTGLALIVSIFTLRSGSAFPVYAAAGDITRLSVSSGGVEGNGYSRSADISADGRYVAFRSEASNLVSGDTNGDEDIFLRDRQTGQTTRISISSSGE